MGESFLAVGAGDPRIEQLVRVFLKTLLSALVEALRCVSLTHNMTGSDGQILVPSQEKHKTAKCVQEYETEFCVMNALSHVQNGKSDIIELLAGERKKEANRFIRLFEKILDRMPNDLSKEECVMEAVKTLSQNEYCAGFLDVALLNFVQKADEDRRFKVLFTFFEHHPEAFRRCMDGSKNGDGKEFFRVFLFNKVIDQNDSLHEEGVWMIKNFFKNHYSSYLFCQFEGALESVRQQNFSLDLLRLDVDMSTEFFE